MKVKSFYLLLYAYQILFAEILIAQSVDSAIVLHPIIGSKLDRVEEEYFKLLPAFNVVNEAVFYLNPDSTLNVWLRYESDGIIEDTLILGYFNYSRLNNYIENRIIDELNDARKVERGEYVSVITPVDSTAGELLTVNNNYITILNLTRDAYKKYNQPPFDARNLGDTDIKKLIVIQENNAARIIYPSILGLGLGITAAVIAKKKIDSEPPKEFGEGWDFTPLTHLFLGCIAGGLIGYGLSELLPITVTSMTEYDYPFNEDDIIGLRRKSRYKK